MRDEEQSDATVGLQVGQQVEDALLDRDVERARRLIRHDQVGGGDHGESDEHALQHPAGKLMRVRVVDALRIAQPDTLERVEDERSAQARIPRLDEGRRCVRLAPDGAHGVERIGGVLRDEADLASPQRAKPAIREAERLCALEPDAAACPRTLGQKAQDRPGDRGLARAGLADEREALAAAKPEARVEDDLVPAVRDRQALDAEEVRRSAVDHVRFLLCVRVRTSCAASG